MSCAHFLVTSTCIRISVGACTLSLRRAIKTHSICRSALCQMRCEWGGSMHMRMPHLYTNLALNNTVPAERMLLVCKPVTHFYVCFVWPWAAENCAAPCGPYIGLVSLIYFCSSYYKRVSVWTSPLHIALLTLFWSFLLIVHRTMIPSLPPILVEAVHSCNDETFFLFLSLLLGSAYI